MDNGRIAAEGSPARADRASGRPARCVELRFAAGRASRGDAGRAARAASADRVEVLPDRRAALHRRRRRGAAGGARARCRAAVGPGAPVSTPRGRLPAPDRPDAGGLMTATLPTAPPPGAAAGAADVAARAAVRRLLAGAVPRTWRGHGGHHGPLAAAASSPRWASGSARWSTTAPAPRPLGGVSYLVFIAPGLLAATAMQTGVGRVDLSGAWARSSGTAVPRACSRRPLRRASTSLVGHLLCVALRVADQRARLPGRDGAVRRGRTRGAACSRLPAAVLTGTGLRRADRSPSRRTRENDNGFALLFRFVIMPMFLFSGTFFPVEPAARLAASRSPASRRSGTASTCAASSRSGTVRPAWRSVHVAYLLALDRRRLRARAAVLHAAAGAR